MITGWTCEKEPQNMTFLDNLKKATERATGWRRPGPERLSELLRSPKPAIFRFRDDGMIPNHPRWPVVVYRRAVRLPRDLDPAAVMEDIFESNGWDDSWRGEIYDYLHFHSRIHEVLGVARGSARVRLGGNRGRTFKVTAGDVIVLPAGTGHQSLAASRSFMVVGAYPPSGTYDECAPIPGDYALGVKRIGKVARPRRDPVFGAKGPLLKLWQAKR
jgi:uncharacterized protein YjlB